MGKSFELRDPVHNFIHLDQFERAVMDSGPFQRLRHINQLALSSLVYPGATHRRFEHSLGVMHLAGQIFDVVTRPENLTDKVRDVVPDDGLTFQHSRSALRIAALLHDTGHLPFSHAAEDDLLPEDWDHERLTNSIIHSPEMKAVWDNLGAPISLDLVTKIALGPRKAEKLKLGLEFSPWEAILAEIVVSDVFGADRIDYLLRDSLHTGVAYGHFDHHRLIQTMRILTPSPAGEDDTSTEPQVGIKLGGIESAEGLLLARYFMFGQVYYHPTRLIYDEHLKDFLTAWLPGGKFATDVSSHLEMTDNEVTAAMREAARKADKPGHEPARRIVTRDHFRVVYQRQPSDDSKAVHAMYLAAREKFGAEHVKYGGNPKKPDSPDFPVQSRNGDVFSSLSLSEVLNQLPVSRNEYIFAEKPRREEIETWLQSERDHILEGVLQQEVEEGQKGTEMTEQETAS